MFEGSLDETSEVTSYRSIYIRRTIMALTQGEWSPVTVNDEFFVASCSIIGGAAADRYISTKISPKGLDGSKPFTVIITTGEDMTAAGTTVSHIYGAYSDTASVGSTGTLTSCVLIASNTTDLDAGATAVIHVLPGVNGNVTQVTSASPGWSVLPTPPRYIFAAFTSADLTAAPATVTFRIYQKDPW